ncbi:MAG: tripartite tricarboxylate transporter substrate binding protein [Burkholderiales bacterium]|nr:tripartite tricarboxylate transporter substrate binding protein [Burkholderiales bacterium]
MNPIPLNRRHWLATAGAMSLWPRAWSQSYPERPVKIIVAFAPAGPSDIMGRWLAQRLSERNGKSFVVENMAGAGGNIGMGAAAKAPPNGYTLLLASSTYVINPSLYKSVPYDPFKDFAPISMVGESPHVFFVHPSVKAQNLRQLIDLVRSQPGKFSYVSAGSGTVAHLSVEQLKIGMGLDMTHIPFKGAGPAVQSVVSGEIAIGCTTLPAVKELVRGNLLRALAVTSTQRFASSPQIPTVAESGFADQESSTWQSLMAPAGTPAPVLQFLHREVVAIVNAPGAREQLVDLGFTAIGNSPAQLGAQIQSEIERWRKVIQAARIEA